MQYFADAWNADLTVLTVDQYPAHPICNKFAVGEVCKAYDRTLFIDIDAWIRNHCPNPFEAFDADKLWMHRDSPFNKDLPLLRDAVQLGDYRSVTECWNTGVVIMNKSHAHIWKPPRYVEHFTHGIEQSSVENRIYRTKTPVTELPTAWNTQWWFKKQVDWDNTFIWHLAGCGHETRLKNFKDFTSQEGTIPR
jgi:hypothetical protein